MRYRSASLLLITIIVTGFGIGDRERGNRLYREGRYAEAVAAYRQALADGDDGPVLRFNLGTALLRMGRYEEAEPQLRAAVDAANARVEQPALFNLGSRFLEAGRAETDPEARRRLLQGAVDAYRRVLRMDPASADAKWNYEMALSERNEQPSLAQSGNAGEERPRPQGQPRPGERPGTQQNRSQTQQVLPLTREQAERLLAAVEQNERDVVRRQLRERRETTVARDW
ncbi:MAG: tetratricopeptide repeat protein [Gemmatimonadota bacterium]